MKQDIEPRSREDLEIFQTIFEKSSLAMAILEPDTTISMVNDAFCKMIGFDKEEVVGISWTKLSARDEVERLRKINQSRIAEIESTPNNYEFFFFTKSGEKRHGMITAALIKPFNKTIVTFTNISELKNTEETLKEREFFFKESQRAGNIGSYKVDLIKGTWESSEVFDQIFGIDKNFSRICHDNWITLIHPDDRDRMVKHLYHGVLKEKKPFDAEYRIIRFSDGAVKWVYGLGKIILDGNDRPSVIIGTIQDISPRKLAEEELKANESRLKELNAAKDKFFSIIAHDLRSPFSIIVGLSELLAEESGRMSAEEISQNANILYKTASSTFTLLENLLEWSQLQSGKLKLKKETILMRDFMKELNESFNMTNEHKPIELNIRMPKNLTITADPNMLRSILRNLLTNAIKFSNPGGVVNVVVLTTEANGVLFSVSDKGIGMPPEILNNLFRIDVNVSRQGTLNEPSSGLGLILCKDFIDKHGGRIWATSEVNQGSTFYFTLPGSCAV